MLNLWPWRILKKKLAANKPGTDWFNAVTRALATIGVRVGGEEEAGHIERPNRDGSNWNIVLPGSILKKGGQNSRWTFSIAATLTMTVGIGIWSRNNHDISWPGGNKVLASGTNKHYLYFELEESTGTKDPALEPDKFADNEIKSSTTYPADPYNKILVLGEVTVTGSAITGYIQYLFSDKKDWCDTPDKGVQAVHPSETIERNANGGWQLVDADETASREKYAKLDSSNKLTWAAVTATDEKVGVDSGATPGYLGAGDSEGVLQCDGTTIGKTDGGNFITLGVKLDSAGGAASTGRGIPAGGTQYMPLTKNSNNDYDVHWDWLRAH